MKTLIILTALIICTFPLTAQIIHNDNVIDGKGGTYYQGFFSNGPSGKWGFAQNHVFMAGIGGNVYSRGFSANARGIFNGSTTGEDIYLYNRNSPKCH